MKKTPLITLEITITPLQAAALSNALEIGSHETNAPIARSVGDMLDRARRQVEVIPNCAGTTIREWLAPSEG